MSNVWCADDTILDDLIYLGRENLVVDRPKEDKVPSIREALLAGQSPASVLSSDATNIPLHAVKKITTDRNDTDIEITYAAGKEDEQKTLHLASPEKRDEVFAALREVYGGRFEQFEEAYSRPQASVGSLSALTIFLNLTLIFAMAASDIQGRDEIEISGRNQAAKSLFVSVLDFIGPLGVWIVGGILCTLSALALLGALLEPPIMLTLQEPPYKKKSVARMIGIYALILVGWAYAILVLRAMWFI